MSRGASYGFPEAWTPGTRSVDDSDVRVVYGGSDIFGFTMVTGDVGADGVEELLISEMGQDRVWILDPSVLFPD